MLAGPSLDRTTRTALLAVLSLALPLNARAEDWGQWGRNAQHDGQSNATGQRLEAILARTTYDPFAAQAIDESGGGLLAHYPVPLLDGDSVYSLIKGGTFVPCNPVGTRRPFPCGADAWSQQTWSVRRLDWRDGALVEVWRTASDWLPVPNSNGLDTAGGLGGWEPTFQPVLSGDSVWLPGGDGSVIRVAKDDGHVIVRATPFGSPAPGVYTSGGLAADAQGNVYYNALSLEPAAPWSANVRGAWLVRAAPDGTTRTADFAAIVTGAPAAGAQCRQTFANTDLPWPPAPNAVPPSAVCGGQRPGINVIPALAPDGTIYTMSRAHFNAHYSYIVALNPDLTPRWASSLRDELNDGCNVLLAANGSAGGCRTGATTGVDPATNEKPAGQVNDLSSASPVVLPDATIVYGAYTRYNGSRGHLMRWTPAGKFIGSYDFGWDSTPAVFRHGSTFSVIIKDNHYPAGYCGVQSFCPSPRERYDITSLTPDLRSEWHFTATNTQNCHRDANGQAVCQNDHPDGFEWCVNQPAVDATGVVYANSEDGGLYAINPDGRLREGLFLDQALGAAYTPLSIAADGRIYSQNYGDLFVVGRH